MGAEQALKGPIVGSKAPERTGGWLAGRSRGGVRGYAIGLLALVLAAAVALALAPFVDAKSASLLLLGAVMAPGSAVWPSIALLAARQRSLLADRVSSTTVHAGDALSLGLFLVEAADQPPRLSAPRGSRPAGLGRASPALAEVQSAATAQELQAEIATLDRLGLTLAGHLDLGRLVKAVTDAGVAVTGAAFGAFLYRDASGVWTHCVSGAPPEAFVDFPLSQDAEAFGSPFQGAVSRSDDLAVRPSLWPEPPVQADAARPPARAELSRGARALRHRRPAGRPLLRTSEPGGLPCARRAPDRRPRGPRGHRRRQRAPLPRGAGGAHGGRDGQPGEGRVPGHAVARAADAADRDRRVGVPAPARPAHSRRDHGPPSTRSSATPARRTRSSTSCSTCRGSSRASSSSISSPWRSAPSSRRRSGR